MSDVILIIGNPALQTVFLHRVSAVYKQKSVQSNGVEKAVAIGAGVYRDGATTIQLVAVPESDPELLEHFFRQSMACIALVETGPLSTHTIHVLEELDDLAIRHDQPYVTVVLHGADARSVDPRLTTLLGKDAQILDCDDDDEAALRGVIQQLLAMRTQVDYTRRIAQHIARELAVSYGISSEDITIFNRQGLVLFSMQNNAVVDVKYKIISLIDITQSLSELSMHSNTNAISIKYNQSFLNISWYDQYCIVIRSEYSVFKTVDIDQMIQTFSESGELQ